MNFNIFQWLIDSLKYIPLPIYIIFAIAIILALAGFIYKIVKSK